jgi:hypothetical protein
LIDLKIRFVFSSSSKYKGSYLGCLGFYNRENVAFEIGVFEELIVHANLVKLILLLEHHDDFSSF